MARVRFGWGRSAAEGCPLTADAPGIEGVVAAFTASEAAVSAPLRDFDEDFGAEDFTAVDFFDEVFRDAVFFEVPFREVAFFDGAFSDGAFSKADFLGIPFFALPFFADALPEAAFFVASFVVSFLLLTGESMAVGPECGPCVHHMISAGSRRPNPKSSKKGRGIKGVLRGDTD